MWFHPHSVQTSTTHTLNSPNSSCMASSSWVFLIRPEY